MNSNQIHTFLTVAKHQSITKASNELFISQPAVSRQIMTLENELGSKLFRQVGRNIVLTEFGVEIRQFFIKAGDEFEYILDRNKTKEAARKRELRIAYPSIWNITRVFSDAVEIIESNYPEVRIVLLPESFTGLSNKVINKEYDGAILFHGDTSLASTKIGARIIADVHQIILYSRKHPAAAKGSDVSLEDFQGSKVFCLPADVVQDMDERVRETEEYLGLDLEHEIADTWQTCLSHVYRGEGIVMIDEFAVEAGLPEYLTYRTERIQTLVFFYRKASKDAILNEFINVLSDCLAL